MRGSGVGFGADCASGGGDTFSGMVPKSLTVVALCRQRDAEVACEAAGGIEDGHGREAKGLRVEGGEESKDHRGP